MSDAVRNLLSDVLEFVGLVAVCVGLGMAAAQLWSPLGPLVGGVALVAGVQILDYLGQPKPEKPRARSAKAGQAK